MMKRHASQDIQAIEDQLPKEDSIFSSNVGTNAGTIVINGRPKGSNSIMKKAHNGLHPENSIDLKMNLKIKKAKKLQPLDQRHLSSAQQIDSLEQSTFQNSVFERATKNTSMQVKEPSVTFHKNM